MPLFQWKIQMDKISGVFIISKLKIIEGKKIFLKMIS